MKKKLVKKYKQKEGIKSNGKSEKKRSERMKYIKVVINHKFEILLLDLFQVKNASRSAMPELIRHLSTTINSRLQIFYEGNFIKY